ncbi:MAG: hypothetical protein Q8M29_01570 [Bacteroidota bacterium]|nr:hypothetical protein [Bacteroidota bacterium]
MILLLTLFSCLPSTDKKKDNSNKGKITSLGNITSSNCTVDEFYFSINNKTIEQNLLPYGCTLGLRLKGISGFKAKNARLNESSFGQGKIFCNASMKVLDTNNVVIVNAEDVLKSNYPDGMKEETFTDIIELFLYLQSPIKMNEKYKFVFSLKDKEGNAAMEISEYFTTRPTKGLQYEEKGLTADGFFIYRNNMKTGAMSENVIFHGDTLLGYFTGLKGFAEVDGRVWIDGSIRYYSDQSELLGEFPDLFKADDEKGFSPEEVKKYFAVTFISNPMIYGMEKDFSIVIRIKDKKSDASLVAKYYYTGKSR